MRDRHQRTVLVSAVVAALATAFSMASMAPSAATLEPSSADASATTAALPAPQSGAEVFTRPSDGVFDIVGGGFGHGIGMSQYGAQGAAKAGLTTAKILAYYYPGTNLVAESPTTVRIGITSDDDGIVRVGARPGLAARISGTTTTLPSSPTQWRVRATGTTASTCRVESYDGSAWTAWHAGSTPCPVRFSAPEGTVDLFLPGGERRVYRGTITAHHRGTTSLATVNTTTMQFYLRGVVPSEMPPSWAAAALGAQAVAARTYAARRTNGTSYYDTCDTTACQVYLGRGRRNADGTITSHEYSSTNSAIAATDGDVLTFRFSDGVTRLATTMYSSSSGGHTAAGGAGHPYLSAHDDAYDGVSGNSRHSWTATLPAGALEARYGIYRVERIQVLDRDGQGAWGGRILTVRVEGHTSGGAYTYRDTTGNGLAAARPWPSWSTGLSSNYFTILPAGTVSRVATGDVYRVAATVATRYTSSGVPVVYVTGGGSAGNQLVASARAAYNDGPLLLTASSTLPAVTRDAMVRLQPGRVVVIGPVSTVSDAVAEQLRSLTTTGSLQRVTGTSTYETAALLSSYWAAGTATAYVAAGDSVGDALSGAALAGRSRSPILLATQNTLPSVTASELRRLRPSRIVILGGTGSVSSTVAGALKAYATSGTVSRVGGADRYASSAAVGSQYDSAARAFLASGATYQHALVMAATAGRFGQPVLLTAPTSLPSGVRTQFERLTPKTVDALGSTSQVSDAVLDAVRAAIG